MPSSGGCWPICCCRFIVKANFLSLKTQRSFAILEFLGGCHPVVVVGLYVVVVPAVGFLVVVLVVCLVVGTFVVVVVPAVGFLVVVVFGLLVVVVGFLVVVVVPTVGFLVVVVVLLVVVVVVVLLVVVDV